MRDALPETIEASSRPGPIAQAIETERLVLRTPDLEDAEFVGRESGRPEVANLLARVPSPNPALFAEMFILSARASEQIRGDVLRLVTRKADGEPLGMISAHDRGELGWELGYWFAPAAWGQGYATEAARALLEALRAAGRTQFHSGHFVENLGSRRVLTKLGFVDTGDHTPVFSTARMRYADHTSMALTA